MKSVPSLLVDGTDVVDSGAGGRDEPEFLERIKPLGTSLRLNEGEKKPITLKISAQ